MDIVNIIYGSGASVQRLKEYEENLKIELNTQMVKRRILHAARPVNADDSEILMFPAYYYSLVSPTFGYLVIYMTDGGDLGWRIVVAGNDTSIDSNVLDSARLDIAPWTTRDFIEICKRASTNELFIERAKQSDGTFTSQFSIIKSGNLSPYDGLDVEKFNQAVMDLDLLCIDSTALRMQLSSLVQEIRDTLESLGVHVDSSKTSSSTTTSAPASVAQGTKGMPVENSTKADLCKRMENGEGTFVWGTTYGPRNHGYIIEIIYDYSAHKLRARTNDGVNGIGWVAFPNNLRKQDAVYFVKEAALSFNGKNYRVSDRDAIILIP